jgi:hypothetical protein
VSDVVTIVEQPTTVTVTDNITGDSTIVTVNEETVTVLSIAEQGPAGPPGESGDANFTQNFSVTTSVTVTHNLGKYPSVTVLDSAGDECEGSVDHLSINQLVVTFSAPFSGIVVCN